VNRTPLEEVAAAIPEGIVISVDLPWTDEQVAEFRERIGEAARQGLFGYHHRSPGVADEATSSCAGCGSGEQVVWCGAYTAWLCPDCRDHRGQRELKPTGLLLGLTDG